MSIKLIGIPFATCSLLGYFCNSCSLTNFIQTQDPVVQCQQSIAESSRKLVEEHRAPIWSVYQEDIEESTPWQTTKSKVSFSLGSRSDPYTRTDSGMQQVKRAGELMNNEKAQTKIASFIFDSCSETVKVSFGIAQSDGVINYYRMPSGEYRKVLFVSCENRRIDIEKPLPWGSEWACT